MEKKISKKNKTPWPTKDAMAQVYEKELWGSGTSRFYSGEGSHHLDIVTPYLDVVRSFLKSFEAPLVVCDLGCGDFNVGKELVKYTKRYEAVDIVESLIAYNKKQFSENNLTFTCLDVAVDSLPVGDCAIVRQVLQHLSNTEVQQVLNKLMGFKYVILTEHIPDEDFIPNIDIISGQGTRLKKNSGINVLASPFRFDVKESTQLLSVKVKGMKGVIVTTLYTL
ncbi:hypothetical protein SCB49_05470 [unidentified eubacterium SCB49]|nr:hypothetical protein SCB49_05470 [unidentified eubacterium SCB49]